jgi:hypothetical protein
MLPKLGRLVPLWRLEGGLPPLEVAGGGMGDGECEGDVTRGFVGGVGNEGLWGGLGALCAIAGEPAELMEPKFMLGLFVGPTGPPFDMGAGIVTADGFLLCSTCPEAPFAELLVTMVGAPPIEGTAGEMAFLPFTAETEDVFACCDADRPTATWGPPDAICCLGLVAFA